MKGNTITGTQIMLLDTDGGMLAQAIADAACKLGISSEGVALTGPHLLMLLGDIVKVVEGLQRKCEEATLLLSDAGMLLGLLYPDEGDMKSWREEVSKWLAQPAPAAVTEHLDCVGGGKCGVGGYCGKCPHIAPAADEQGDKS